MPQIRIISASIRDGRQSHRVALFFKKFIEERRLGTVEILDLKEFDFPVFHERLRFQETPDEKTLEFAEAVKKADGIIIVTPEYNGGYPASLKNVIDLLYAEWKRKPIGVAMVSDGVFGGTQVITSLLFTLWKIGALMVPAMFTVPHVQDNYDEEGNALDKEHIEKRATVFIDELLWYIKAITSA